MFSNNANETSKVQLQAQLILAIGLVLAAFVLGYQTKTIGAGRSSVQIKGLAEKSIKSDSAEWRVKATGKGESFADALAALRKNKQQLIAFIDQQGLSGSYETTAEHIEPFFVEVETQNGNTRQVQNGYSATQTILIRSKNLDLISKSYAAILDYKSSGHDVEYQAPDFLVSNLEEIKMSLIHAATENSKKRAKEFIRGSDTELGAIRSASQGAFYILANTNDMNNDDYGGRYDKTTIEKIARVVVTVEYNLK